ncbi:MAG: Sb-PDE family phosphodiesterase [Marinilabiliaceae bacterium]|nr:Sb-PDE family phosphodiesterase [Marinilabiliaceae bacterium]
MKRLASLIFTILIVLPLYTQVRGNIDIPDLNGFVTLKCDFHIHTVFSDGLVWPSVRVDEAYREGLDAISITDHIEYRPYKNDVAGSFNRSYEIAKESAVSKGIIVIPGSEITRNMPPGHSNALFLNDADKLDKPDYQDAFRAAGEQNAFIFWNHPCWDAQQPNEVKWFDEHSKLHQEGLLHGIEVVNGVHYCREAHKWAIEKNLTLIGSSDVHAPMQSSHFFKKDGHRSMTLVFARTKTAEGIQEALTQRRTAIYYRDNIIGDEIILKELFEKAVEITMKKEGQRVRITFTNNSQLFFHLKKTDFDDNLTYFRDFIIEPHGKHTTTVKMKDGINSGEIKFSVENFLVEPDKGMKYSVKIE